MKVKSVSESTDRYVKGCIRAYLESSKDFGWITSIIGSSEDSLGRAALALAQLGTYGDSARRFQLAHWISESRQQLSASSVQV